MYRMGIASIKLLSISLVLLCIFITTFVCTFLAIASSDKALDDIKESRDSSVSSCFATSAESVTNRTIEYLEVVLDGVETFLREYAKTHRRVAMSLARELMDNPWDDIKMWEWHRPQRYFHAFDTVRPDGNTGAGIMLKNMIMILNFEDTTTILSPDSHDLSVTLNYGTDHPWGGYGRTFHARNDGKGRALDVDNVLEDVLWSPNATEEALCAIKPQKTPCGSLGDWKDPPNSPFYSMVYAIQPNSTWLPPQVVSTGYISINFFVPVYHEENISGVAFSGAHLDHISSHLQQLSIASRGRVYVTVRSTSVDWKEAVGMLVGTSHGRAVGDTGLVSPKGCGDEIIESIASQTADMDLDKSEGLETVRVGTGDMPKGEDFYYRVGRSNDGYGADWYVHLIIDREYILGSIDNRTAETRYEINRVEENVDSDLATGRSVLYASVVGVAVGLTVLSVLFVLRIIEPLLVLEKEMAAVAVMKLQGVDTTRPLSALKEVRLMQVSFLQMIEDLKEYKNYIPASVLQEQGSSSKEEGITKEEESSDERSNTSPSSSVGRFAMGFRTQSFCAEIRIKKVTLAVCNIVGFLGTPPHIRPLVIASYLATGLQQLKLTRGIPDSFSGDRLYASWNGVRVSASHRQAAYTFSRELCGEKYLKAKLSIGIASGEVQCGNMGCDAMKKFSYIGSLSSWVHVVERIGRSMECDVAIDSRVHEEVRNKAYTRMLQHVEFAKHSSRVLRVYEAMRPKELITAQEWMYQLELGTRNDPNKAYNRSYELFVEGRVEEALREFRGQPDDDSAIYRGYKRRLSDAMHNPSLCEPLTSWNILCS